jgi:hypothetical protein
MEARSSVWPLEILSDPRPVERRGPNHLRCFFVCPFTPKDVYDDLYRLVQHACNAVGTDLHCELECIRADAIVGSGVIHAEIWHEIQTADVIIADISGMNGNVLLELGVAAAIRRKEHVVVLMHEDQDQRFLFDLGPVRHILYRRTYEGFNNLLSNLRMALLMAITTAPADQDTSVPMETDLSADFTKGTDVDWLVGPSLTHRRIVKEGLEFGSLFVYRNSWLRVVGEFTNLELQAEMRFSGLRDQPAWIGIGVRSQNFFANWSNLLYVRADGSVIRTVIENDLGQYHDEEVGHLQGFALERYVTFRIRIDGTEFVRSIDDVQCKHDVASLPHVFPKGMVLLQTYNARAILRKLDLRRVP